MNIDLKGNLIYTLLTPHVDAEAAICQNLLRTRSVHAHCAYAHAYDFVVES